MASELEVLVGFAQNYMAGRRAGFTETANDSRDAERRIERLANYKATPPADAALADALETIIEVCDGLMPGECATITAAAAALRARAVTTVPLSALVCVGRARFPRTGGNAGIAWYVEDALSDTGGFCSGSPCNGELLFVLPTTAKRALLAASNAGGA